MDEEAGNLVKSPQGLRAAARAQSVNEAMDRDAYARLRGAALGAKTAAKRLVWLQRAADVVGQAVERSGAAACRRGCGHCCQIAVQATQLEAEAIAAYSGRAMNVLPARSVRPAEAASWEDLEETLSATEAESRRRYGGKRCPFLSASNECTVYAVRPQACRLHFSLGDDDSSCRLDETGGRSGASIFMFDTLEMKAADAIVLGLHQPIADIREWFGADEVQS